MHKPWRVSFHRDDDRATGAIRPVVGVPGLCGGDGALNLGREERTSGREESWGKGEEGGGRATIKEDFGIKERLGIKPQTGSKDPQNSLDPQTFLDRRKGRGGGVRSDGSRARRRTPRRTVRPRRGGRASAGPRAAP